MCVSWTSRRRCCRRQSSVRCSVPGGLFWWVIPTNCRPSSGQRKRGDCYQIILSTLFLNNLSNRSLGADESLFKRLDSMYNTIVLTKQYRMNRTITRLANDLTYEGALECGSVSVSSATLHIPDAIVTGFLLNFRCSILIIKMHFRKYPQTFLVKNGSRRRCPRRLTTQ